MTEPVLTLKPGREKTVRRRHPWIFSGAVAHLDGGPGLGDTVVVRSAAGEFLARAAYSPHSQIRARVWSWDGQDHIDADFVAGRIARSVAARAPLAQVTDAVRLVNAESDGVPGLVVDRYADVVVCQFLTAGAEYWKGAIVDALAGLPGVTGVYERSDVDAREKEGLQPSAGVLGGAPPPDEIVIWEKAGGGSASAGSRWRFAVDVRRGHKTGFYLDQRDNRSLVADLALGKKALNVFAYTGAFTVCALLNGATAAVSLDSSAPALALAARNLELNGLAAADLIAADAFKALRDFRDRGETFDLIILDPPKFAHATAQINRAARAYKDLNWLALRLLNPGGYLVTFSCSGLVSEDLFQKIVFGAALDAGREAQILRRLGQASDHPVLLSFPEAAYLKGFVCRVA